MKDFIVKTKRLYLRQMVQSDFASLCEILQDKEVMYAYEHAFDDNEVQVWLDNQLKRYKENGLGLWAVVLVDSGEMIGQCGLTFQQWEDKKVLEVGYLLQKKYWGQGYAIEAAEACKQYAFNVVGFDEVYSIIRDNNIASQNVAKNNGMIYRGQFTKHYYNMDMLHYVYSVKSK